MVRIFCVENPSKCTWIYGISFDYSCTDCVAVIVGLVSNSSRTCWTQPATSIEVENAKESKIKLYQIWVLFCPSIRIICKSHLLSNPIQIKFCLLAIYIIEFFIWNYTAARFCYMASTLSILVIFFCPCCFHCNFRSQFFSASFAYMAYYYACGTAMHV